MILFCAFASQVEKAGNEVDRGFAVLHSVTTRLDHPRLLLLLLLLVVCCGGVITTRRAISLKKGAYFITFILFAATFCYENALQIGLLGPLFFPKLFILLH